jgi:hypothetical protein
MLSFILACICSGSGQLSEEPDTGQLPLRVEDQPSGELESLLNQLLSSLHGFCCSPIYVLGAVPFCWTLRPSPDIEGKRQKGGMQIVRG